MEPWKVNQSWFIPSVSWAVMWWMTLQDLQLWSNISVQPQLKGSEVTNSDPKNIMMSIDLMKARTLKNHRPHVSIQDSFRLHFAPFDADEILLQLMLSFCFETPFLQGVFSDPSVTTYREPSPKSNPTWSNFSPSITTCTFLFFVQVQKKKKKKKILREYQRSITWCAACGPLWGAPWTIFDSRVNKSFLVQTLKTRNLWGFKW